MAKRGRAEVVAALTSAMQDGRAVGIERAPESAPSVGGHVVAVGIRWCILQPTHGEVFDGGYTAVRLKDVRRVRTAPPDRETEVAAPGIAVAAPVGVDPTTTGTLLSTASELFGIVAVHCERRRRPRCWMGRVLGIADKQLSFGVVNAATLAPKKQKNIAFREITSIEFGGTPFSA